MAGIPLKLSPGINTDQTPLMNEGGYVASNQIRFRNGVPEKRGGFSKFCAYPVAGVPRAIAPYIDLSNVAHTVVAHTAGLGCITAGVLANISPLVNTTSTASGFSTTNGSAVVRVTDANSNCTNFDVVLFIVPVAVGGVTLQGLYATTAVDTNTYSVVASSSATSTSMTWAVPTFTTTAGQFSIVVGLANHGLSAGTTVSFQVPTAVGGLTVSGFYTVQSVSTNTYTIYAQAVASSSATASMNTGVVRILYNIAGLPPTPALGYGVGPFGFGAFGTEAVSGARVSAPLAASDWSLAVYGEVVYACPVGGGIYGWAPSGGFTSANLNVAAPPASSFIMAAENQQMLIAFGTSVLNQQDPLLIRWSDAGNPNQWNALPTNQAGSKRLPTGSKIVGAVAMSNGILVLTDVDAWMMQYIGYPNTWSFNRVATGCGLIGQKAIAKINNAVYWMSQNEFWTFNGNGSPIQCTVKDSVFANMQPAYASNVRACANSAFGEVVWYYPSLNASDGENDTYACLNTLLKLWDVGSQNRTAWSDQSAVAGPLGAGKSGYVYSHETSTDADGAPLAWSLSTGFFELDNGSTLPYLSRLLTDIKWLKPGIMSMTVSVKNGPDDVPRVLGPYVLKPGKDALPLNISGRLFALTFSGSDLGSMWRFGNFRLRVQGIGRNV